MRSKHQRSKAVHRKNRPPSQLCGGIIMWNAQIVLSLLLAFATPFVLWANDNFIAGGQGVDTAGFWEIRSSSSLFETSGQLWAGRVSHCAIRLQNGNLMLVGGTASNTTWEIRNPSGGHSAPSLATIEESRTTWAARFPDALWTVSEWIVLRSI
jgi:hypothetical protein